MHFSGCLSGSCLYLKTSLASGLLVRVYVNAALLEHRELWAADTGSAQKIGMQTNPLRQVMSIEFVGH